MPRDLANQEGPATMTDQPGPPTRPGPSASGAARDGSSGPARDASTFHEPLLRLRLAWAAAAWERVWPAVWPFVAVVLVFAALALFDALPALPGWLHALALVVFAGGAGWALWRGLRGLALPDRMQARRRLETDSGLAHRPLTTLAEAQATGAHDAAGRALWSAHRRRAEAALGALRNRWPRPGLAARDRYGLRGAIGLVLVVAVVAAWGDWLPRFARAVTPGLATPAGAQVATLDLFVTPPDYTGAAPIYLRPPGQGAAEDATAGPADPADPADPAEPAAIRVPEGSTLLARVTGGNEAPILHRPRPAAAGHDGPPRRTAGRPFNPVRGGELGDS